VTGGRDIAFEDDSTIKKLAARLGIHQCYGPSPSVEMLVQDLAAYAQFLLASMPMKEPLPVQSWNFVLATSFANTWFFMLTILPGVTMLKLLHPVELEGQG
jgi:hypothetical protein